VRQWLSEKVTALDAEQAALESKKMVSMAAAGSMFPNSSGCCFVLRRLCWCLRALLRSTGMDQFSSMTSPQCRMAVLPRKQADCVLDLCWALQVLLKAESKLRAQEIEASLLDEAAISLSTAAATGAAAATRDAVEKHGRELAAAKRQLMMMTTQQQQEQREAAEEQQEADRRNR
jgi:hypothetical protein